MSHKASREVLWAIIDESAYRLECEVVREIGAHSAIVVVSYAANVHRLTARYT
jgi:hypothetical protein